MNPHVEVIAVTKFLGVPCKLRPMFEEHQKLNKFIESQDQGPDIARLTECAGRTCYDSYGTGRSSAEYHNHILQVGHGSVLEHASISFYISGISRGCSHELVRHRAGCAISQRSTRYVDESESEWVWHPLLSDEDGNPPVTSELSFDTTARQMYKQLVEYVETKLLLKGIDKQTARKQARGAARGALGNALETSMVWTANIRALRNVLEQRASKFADAEIRLLANRLYEESLQVCPEYFSDYKKQTCPDGIGYELITDYRKV